MVPEFLREGSAVADARMPDRVVIGTRDDLAAEILSQILSIGSCPTIVTSSFSAEAIKYFSNVFLATCISLSNELFDLVNRDPDCVVPDILEGWHFDRRFIDSTGSRAPITNYLVPGPGFGGSCFPKDVSAVSAQMDSQGLHGKIVKAVIERNQLMPSLTCDWISEHVPKGGKILLLGMSFKEGTDDLRDSPAIFILQELDKMGYQIEWIDNRLPQAQGELPKARIRNLGDSDSKFYVLTNHEITYRNFLMDLDTSTYDSPITVLAIRYQPPIKGFNWLYPRQRGD
jgi:UDPglucose 6-dehydrogenase/GDP-mannose 6-dehydrogenase